MKQKLYIEMLFRHLSAKREWPFLNEPEPKPHGVDRVVGHWAKIRKQVHREFNRNY